MFGPTSPNPTRSLVFAAFYFLIGITAFAGSLRHRWQGTYRNGIPTSPASQIATILAFFVWGTCSVGDAYGWSFVRQHPVLLRFGSMGVVAACFGLDLLREYLPSAQVVGDRRMLRVAFFAFVTLSVLLGIWCISLLL